jgi:hypothetical protein
MPLSGFQETVGSGYLKPRQGLQAGNWLTNKDLQHFAAVIGNGGHASKRHTKIPACILHQVGCGWPGFCPIYAALRGRLESEPLGA